MQTLPPHIDDCDRSLDFWERGPIRRILELEFEAAFVQVMGDTGRRMDAAEEKRVHDAVVPEVFLFVTDNVEWSQGETEAGHFTLARQQLIRREMDRLICMHLVHTVQNALPDTRTVLQPLLMPFRALPRLMRWVLSS